MALKDELDAALRTIKELQGRVVALKEQHAEVQDRLRHFEAAVAAVRWLWEQAGHQPPFQL